MHTRTVRRTQSAAASAVLALALLGMSNAARAQDQYFTGNGSTYTIDSTHSVVGTAYAGKDSTLTMNTSPTVDLVPGGSIGGNLSANDSSVVNLSGGSVG